MTLVMRLVIAVAVAVLAWAVWQNERDGVPCVRWSVSNKPTAWGSTYQSAVCVEWDARPADPAVDPVSDSRPQADHARGDRPPQEIT